MIKQFNFLSSDWMEALRGVVQRLLDADEKQKSASFTYAEIFYGEAGAEEDGYVLKVIKGRADVERVSGHLEDADCVVRMDYQVARETMSYQWGDELMQAIETATNDGKIQVHGSFDAVTVPLDVLHDEMVKVTLST